MVISQIPENNAFRAYHPGLERISKQFRTGRIDRIRAELRARLLLRRAFWNATVNGREIMKRLIDFVGALFLLLLMSPLFVVVALAIKLSDGGSVMFWQNRVGLRGKPFRCPKFRSMVPDAERKIVSIAGRNHHGDSITFKMKDDPRITWIGRIIRRFSIDELPQLWCVLTGAMSLVGPRPALPREVNRYRLAQRRRLDVKPGLTCFWQVRGRGDLPFSQQLELDVQYIESHTLLLDLKLLLLTVPAVFSGRGAY
jgi:lipopolysaccharide/colanic/teichoic acid biosynthesis glycosyltransferase